MSRILMAADVPPGPAIETALLDMSDVVRNEIVSQAVPFVHRAPQLPCFRVYSQPATGIADAIGIDPHTGAIGIELEDVSSIFFLGSGIGIIHIRRRSYRHEHVL